MASFFIGDDNHDHDSIQEPIFQEIPFTELVRALCNRVLSAVFCTGLAPIPHQTHSGDRASSSRQRKRRDGKNVGA